MKLHLGCGHKKIHGFVNIDIDASARPDIVDDITTLSDFRPESIDLIYCCHTLEHLTKENAWIALVRWFELIKPLGLLRLSVPNLSAIFEYYICHKDLKAIHGLLYGGQKNIHDIHYTGWDLETLSKELIKVGFRGVYKYDWRDTEHAHIDDYSQAYLPHISYQTRHPAGDIQGKLVSLNVEAVK